MFTFIAVELLYFIFGANTRSTVITSMIQLSSEGIQSLITRIILFLIQTSAIYFTLFKRYSKTTCFSILQYLKCLLLLFPIRIALDITFFIQFSINYITSLQLILDTIYIYCVFIIIAKKVSSDDKICGFGKKQWVLSAVISGLMIFIITYTLLSYKNNIKTMDIISDKYISGIPNELLENWSFKDNIFSSVYYCAVSIIMFFFYNTSGEDMIKKSKKIKKS